MQGRTLICRSGRCKQFSKSERLVWQNTDGLRYYHKITSRGRMWKVISRILSLEIAENERDGSWWEKKWMNCTSLNVSGFKSKMESELPSREYEKPWLSVAHHQGIKSRLFSPIIVRIGKARRFLSTTRSAEALRKSLKTAEEYRGNLWMSCMLSI